MTLTVEKLFFFNVDVLSTRVLLKSGPGNRGRSACGPTHVARLEFPRETGVLGDFWGRINLYSTIDKTSTLKKKSFSTVSVTQKGSQRYMEKRRGRRELEVTQMR